MNTYVAYYGGLFYNATSKASLFFPAAGYRYPITGALEWAGSMGTYWSKTPIDVLSSWYLDVGGAGPFQSTVPKEQGMSVRCVVDDSPATSVTPDYITLPYTMPSLGSTYSVEVTSTTSWTLTSTNTTWLKLSTNPSATFGTALNSVSGTGNQTIYLYAPDNSSVHSRETTIYLGASPTNVVVTVLQYGDPGKITDNDGAGTPLHSRTYVGAFWKAAETGERLIRILAGAGNTGAWTAEVMWKDANWGPNDRILLDTDMLSGSDLSNRGISFSSNMNPDAYGPPEYYPVSGGSMITGNAATASDYIFFRIGLTTPYTPTSSHPARYAVLLLSYANNTKQQKLFLRQGQEPDYLMMPNDPVQAGSNLSTRTISRKFAVYNLTATTLEAQIAVRGATFTNYPTKAGAFWRWGTEYDNNLARIAFRPWTATSNYWNEYNTPNFWNTIVSYTEVSPDMPVGFRRPNDGSTTSSDPCSNSSIAYSEFRQSLFWKVRSGYNYSSELGNSIWGYYADGFFDRRMLSNGTGMDSNNTVVAAGGLDIAYIGRLFFNPISGSERYHASLFFPAAGWLGSGSGMTAFLMSTGSDGVYWSSSANHDYDNSGLGIVDRENHAGIWRGGKSICTTIRPVVE
jgi:hypothetical protein